MTPPGASAGRKSPKTFLTVDPRGRPYAKRQFKDQAWPPTRVDFDFELLFGGVALLGAKVEGRSRCNSWPDNCQPIIIDVLFFYMLCFCMKPSLRRRCIPCAGLRGGSSDALLHTSFSPASLIIAVGGVALSSPSHCSEPRLCVRKAGAVWFSKIISVSSSLPPTQSIRISQFLTRVPSNRLAYVLESRRPEAYSL